MTTIHATRDRPRLERPAAAVGIARAAMFAAAVGAFLAAPPALPWVVALVAVTNVVHLVARAVMTAPRPSLALLLLNGLTVTLVIAYAATTGAAR